MQIKFTTEKEQPFLVIEYEGQEKEKLVNKFKELGITETSLTENAWDTGLKLNYYRATNNKFFNSLNFNSNYREDYCDDINDDVYSNSCLNIAIFRVETNTNKTKVPLNSLLSIIEINEIAEKISKAIEKIYNINTGEVVVKVNTGLE